MAPGIVSGKKYLGIVTFVEGGDVFFAPQVIATGRSSAVVVTVVVVVSMTVRAAKECSAVELEGG